MRKGIVAAVTALVAFGGLTIAQSQEEFIFVPPGSDEAPQDHFQFHVYQAGSPDRFYGQFRYDRDLDTPGLDAPAGWINGDRCGYSGGYAFLTYRSWIVGRVTYSSIGGPINSGASLNDRYMPEGVRHYGGSTEPPAADPQDGFQECPSGTSRPDLSTGTVFDPMPPVVYYHGPHDVEVRDFADLGDTGVPIHPSLRLRVESSSENQVLIVGYEQLASGAFRARVEIIFDVMVPGGIVPDTMHPVELRTTFEPEPEPSPSPEPTTPPPPPPLTADFDQDGDVDTDDLRAFIEAWIQESNA